MGVFFLVPLSALSSLYASELFLVFFFPFPPFLFCSGQTDGADGSGQRAIFHE